ncbi:MAG: hypothetical protein WCG61_01500 [Chlorobium sp.]
MKIENLINNGIDPVIENGLVRIGKSTLLFDVEYSGPISFGTLNCGRFCKLLYRRIYKNNISNIGFTQQKS